MEDYMLAEAVLQATHMTKFNNKPKYLKRYDIKTSMKHLRVPSARSYQIWRGDKENFRVSVELKIKKSNRSQPVSALDTPNRTQTALKKKKMTLILEQAEKIRTQQKSRSRNFLNEYFIKKQIQPKSSRDHTPRSLTLCRKPQAVTYAFYDVNFQAVTPKARNCLILPESKSDRVQLNKCKEVKSEAVNIQKLIDAEWEQQKHRRKVQCKTASNFTRHKNLLQKQLKKIEQQLRLKETEERSMKKTDKFYFIKVTPSDCINQKTLPMSKEEIKTQTCEIMQKYNIDAAKSYIKLH